MTTNFENRIVVDGMTVKEVRIMLMKQADHHFFLKKTRLGKFLDRIYRGIHLYIFYFLVKIRNFCTR
jgi:hypothetical protein